MFHLILSEPAEYFEIYLCGHVPASKIQSFSIL